MDQTKGQEEAMERGETGFSLHLPCAGARLHLPLRTQASPAFALKLMPMAWDLGLLHKRLSKLFSNSLLYQCKVSNNQNKPPVTTQARAVYDKNLDVVTTSQGMPRESTGMPSAAQALDLSKLWIGGCHSLRIPNGTAL